MKLARRLFLAATLFLLVTCGLAAQQVGLNSVPWMKLHDVHTSAAGPALTRFVDQDLFLARDGTLISVTVAEDLVAGGGFVSTEIAGQAASEALAALTEALFQSRVGKLQGACSAELMPLGSTFTIGISWFGNGSRSSQLTITNQGSPASACTQQELGVLQALRAVQASVIANPLTTITSSQCTGDASCPDGLVCCQPCGIPPPPGFVCPRVCFRPDQATGRCPLFP